MNLDWNLKPHEWAATDALWYEAAMQARQIWKEEHDAEAQAKRT